MGPGTLEYIRQKPGGFMRSGHVPVLSKEIVEALHITEGKRYIDATAGGGGHGVEIVRRGGILFGIDTDPTAVKAARERLSEFDTKLWQIEQGNFRNIAGIARREGIDGVSGVVFDLGVSSMQLDTPDRGFSYRFTDAPLDLRMNQTSGESAAQLVNRATRGEVYDIISTFGEEQLAGRIADAIVHARSVKHIETVGDLIAAVERATGKHREVSYDTLSRVFQALRIAVNDELRSIKEGLTGAETLLEPGGRLAVISFHSLEDRIVKLFMRKNGWTVLTKHPVTPDEEEIRINRRSRSAKLRIAEKI